MKKKQLEIFLQKTPQYKKPDPKLEQYITPANIAADIIFIAYQHNNIQNKKVLDLGCGTGIFSFAAKIAGAKKVIAVDIDKNAIKKAKEFAEKNNLKIEFIQKDITDIKIKCDTILMNPPFGAQKTNIRADRKFIEKAFELSKNIYSLHLTKTIPFIEKMIKSLDGKIVFSKNYNFRMKHIYDFHKKEIMDFEVTLLKISTKK